MSSEREWKRMTLREAGISLIDCDHRTPQAVEHGYPYIAIPQLRDGHISLEGVRRISQEDFLEWTKKLKPRADDVIVVRRCNSGDSAVVPAGLECAIGQNLVVLRANGEVVYPKFLRWLLRGPQWWDQVGKYINVGAVFDSLKCREIPDFELAIPPLDAQIEISALLGGIDDRITLIRETNATLEAITQALFKSWFVDFDPVRAKGEGREPEGMDAATAALFPNTFEDSELGPIPKGWKVSSIGEISSYLNRGISPKYVEEGGVLVLNQKCIRDQIVDIRKARRHDANQRRVEGRELRVGDVLVNSTGVGTLGRVAQVLTLKEPTIVDSHVTVIRAKQGVSHVFLGLALMRRQAEIERLGEGTTGQTELSRGKLSQLRLVSPPSMLGNAFDDLCSPLRERFSENLEMAEALARVRDALLPRLISGQLRLPEAEEQIQEAMA